MNYSNRVYNSTINYAQIMDCIHSLYNKIRKDGNELTTKDRCLLCDIIIILGNIVDYIISTEVDANTDTNAYYYTILSNSRSINKDKYRLPDTIPCSKLTRDNYSDITNMVKSSIILSKQYISTHLCSPGGIDSIDTEDLIVHYNSADRRRYEMGSLYVKYLDKLVTISNMYNLQYSCYTYMRYAVSVRSPYITDDHVLKGKRSYMVYDMGYYLLPYNELVKLMDDIIVYIENYVSNNINTDNALLLDELMYSVTTVRYYRDKYVRSHMEWL